MEQMAMKRDNSLAEYLETGPEYGIWQAVPECNPDCASNVEKMKTCPQVFHI